MQSQMGRGKPFEYTHVIPATIISCVTTRFVTWLAFVISSTQYNTSTHVVAVFIILCVCCLSVQSLEQQSMKLGEAIMVGTSSGEKDHCFSMFLNIDETLTLMKQLTKIAITEWVWSDIFIISNNNNYSINISRASRHYCLSLEFSMGL